MTLVSALLLLLLGSLVSYGLLSFLLKDKIRVFWFQTRPNSRSLHSQVVPKGGGLVIIVSTVSLIGIYAGNLPIDRCDAGVDCIC